MTTPTDNRPRPPVAEDIRILAGMALYHLEEGYSMDVREILEEIAHLAELMETHAKN